MTDTKKVVKDVLSHHGIKGMHWGVRKGEGTPTSVSVTQKGSKLKSSGGENHPAHSDAVKARATSQKLSKSGVHSVSNDELQQLITRKNLESQASRLSSTSSGTAKLQRGNDAVAQILRSSGHLNSAIAFANSPAGQAIKKGVKIAALAA